MKNISRILFTVFIAATLIISAGCADRTHSGIAFYMTDREEFAKGRAAKFLPEPDFISGYRDINYTFCNHRRGLFNNPYGLALFVNYGNDYTEQKKKVLDSYDFLKSSIYVTDISPLCRLPGVIFEHNGFVFGIVVDADIDFNDFGMIGYNDEEQKICYLYYFDNGFYGLGYSDDEAVQQLKHIIDTDFIWP